MLPSVFRRCGANPLPVCGKKKAISLRDKRPVSEVKCSVDARALEALVSDKFHLGTSLYAKAGREAE